MRTLSFACFAVIMMVANALAQTAQALATIPTPLPFPAGSSIFQWDYQCATGAKGCGLSGLGVDRYLMRSASIVLARFKIGEIEMPTYFIWGILIDGSSVSAMMQNEFAARFVAVNMKLVAAGSPGL
jgi:hypothetical protein